MERPMKSPLLDLKRVEAALARVAKKAVSGTREDRNGRFNGVVAMASSMPQPDQPDKASPAGTPRATVKLLAR